MAPEFMPSLACAMVFPQQTVADAKYDQFKVVNCGPFAEVYQVVNTKVAFKITFEPGEAEAVEKRIYERLGTHPLVLKYYGEAESVLCKGLVLQYLPRATLARNLELERFPIERTQ